MSHISLATPQTSLIGFRDQLYTIDSQISFNDDINQRGSGFGSLGMIQSTSFSGGATGSANITASTVGTAGVVTFVLTLSGAGGQSGGVGYGYFSTVRPIILATTQSLIFQARIACDLINIFSGTTRYFFFGLDDCTTVTAGHTNAIGFKTDSTSFQGDRFIASPITRSAGVETKSNPSNCFLLFTGDPKDFWRSYSFHMYYTAGAWKVDFYKFFEEKMLVGSTGEWVLMATHTTNIPSGVVLQPTIHDICASTSVGSAGTDTLKFDHLSVRVFNTVKRF